MAPFASIRKVLSSMSRSGAAIECPACGTDLEIAADACPDCGGELLVECRSCGQTLEGDGAQCRNCGDTDYEVFRLD